MKAINIVFLTIGIILSVISKVFQIFFNAVIGDVIVLPAAVFLVLGLLFSIEKFKTMYIQNKKLSIWIVALVCSAVVFFQCILIFTLGHQNKFGLFFIIPFIATTSSLLYLLIKNTKDN